MSYVVAATSADAIRKAGQRRETFSDLGRAREHRDGLNGGEQHPSGPGYYKVYAVTFQVREVRGP